MLVRTVVVSTLFLTLWLWLLPRVVVGPDAYSAMRLAGLPLVVVGLGIGLWCAFEFAWRGRGTPAPFDPPKHLVSAGPYRYVRNPMSVGFFIAVAGEAIAFPHLTQFMLVMLPASFIATTLFIALYEEPALRRLFGNEYEQYCEHVHRWRPRLTPFDMQRNTALQ